MLLEITYSKTSSPLSLGISDDARELALGFRSISIFDKCYRLDKNIDNNQIKKIFGFYDTEEWGSWSAGKKSCLSIPYCSPGNAPINIIIDAHVFEEAFKFCWLKIRTSSGHRCSVRIGGSKLYNVTLRRPLFTKNQRLVVGDFSKIATSQNVSKTFQIPTVSVVLLNHKQSYLSRLASIAVGSSRVEVPFEILCVDNESSLDSLAELRDAEEPLTILGIGKNIGFSNANNLAAQHAQGEYLLFLNNDAFLDQGAVGEMLKAFHNMPDCIIVGSVLRFPDGTIQEAGASLPPDGRPIRHGRNDPKFKFRKLPRFQPVDYVSGACLMIRKTDFLEIGGFAEKYSPAYYEDTDLCMRSLLYGQKVYLASRANCYHIENATTSTIEQGAWATRTAEAHREIFLKDWGAYLASRDPKHLPWHLRETKHMTTGCID